MNERFIDSAAANRILNIKRESLENLNFRAGGGQPIESAGVNRNQSEIMYREEEGYKIINTIFDDDTQRATGE